MNAIQYPIGYASRGNVAAGQLDTTYFTQWALDAAWSGCLDAIQRMPAGSVERDVFVDDAPFPSIAYRA
ncbi:hypothetical protein DF046_36785 [Burkholderia cepacia]|uniref:hypothetical protein n=1 Tax=Burkholderia cepacia TaxID=292 RepID=UPI000F59881B|nr:hypothetical protein [Burkholderia cepacia]RQT43136.1 hypothetical protein DF046_36785 [Burkholderia cepacia]